ncbi:MAG: D-2-hydroxyacid dehydrogenase [Rhodospirillales bacterium]|nr:D-2-hydroxyacid dehydrogenase [Rhodospirillales bacterium]
MTDFPPRTALRICFAHAAYRMQERFAARATGLASFEVRDAASLAARIGEADVLVVSGLWRNDLIAAAPKLRLIQSISAGTDQYDRAALAAAGIRLASAAGVNAEAVAEHAIALTLALARRLGEARDNQSKRHWRGMIGDLAQREDEIAGKTMLIVGLGRIGGRLAGLAKAFGMRVIGVRRDPAGGLNGADEIHALADLPALLGQAHYVVLTCPLTPATERLMNAATLAAMRPGSFLINCARGRCVEEAALAAALHARHLAGAALDVAVTEPPPPDWPFWAMENVLVSPHSGGETRAYEDNVIDLLIENLARLGRGEMVLKNGVV